MPPIPESLAPFLPWIFVASLAMFVGTLVAIPIVIRRLPADFFLRRQKSEPHPHPVVHVILVVARNAIGAIFVVAGLAMLLLPGQGLITIVLGLALLDFPGRHALERWLLARSSIRRSLNWIRRRVHREPLRFPDDAGE